jgi:hypothetical protein
MYSTDTWLKIPKSCIATLLLAVFQKEVQLTLKHSYYSYSHTELYASKLWEMLYYVF